MKNFFTLFLVLFFIQTTIAEELNEFEGAISTKEGQVLSYKIVYKINRNNTIDGYSLTDIEGENLTKSWIKGKYNPSKKLYHLKKQEMPIPKLEMTNRPSVLLLQTILT